MTQTMFLILLVCFSVAMFVLAVFFRRGADAVTFFAAGRNVGVWATAFASAIGWMWADVFFSVSQIGYDWGVYGVVWFSAMTLLSFVGFAWIGRRVRQDAPMVVTLPAFVRHKSAHGGMVHVAMTLANILYQMVVLGMNATITGFLLHAAFGFDYLMASSSIVGLVLTYSLINGLKTSTYTGIVQFAMVMVLMAIVVVTVIGQAGSVGVSGVLFGAAGDITHLLNGRMMVAMGIPVAVILLTQPIVDQMIFQRLIAMREGTDMVRSFVWTGVLCALGTVMFGVLGLFALALAQQGLISVTDSQLAIVYAIGHYMPEWGLVLFVLAFFAVVFSTVDATYCALAALVGYDLYKTYVNPRASDARLIAVGRLTMVAAAVLAVVFAMAELKILWMLFLIGVIGGAMVAPVAIAMVAKRLEGRWVALGIGLALLVGVPLSLYGNLNGMPMLVSGASVGSMVLGALVCAMGARWRV